jgi:hypothetical protein
MFVVRCNGSFHVIASQPVAVTACRSSSSLAPMASIDRVAYDRFGRPDPAAIFLFQEGAPR